MRQQVGKIRKVRAGDTVRIFCKHTGPDDARLYIRSAYEGDEDFGPLVLDRFAASFDGAKPLMVAPVSVRLGEHRKSHVFEFEAPEAMRLCVVEERDLPGPGNAKARITSHGPAFSNFLRRLRNLFRRAWHRPAQGHAH